MLTSLTAKLLRNPHAAAFSADIPADADPRALADTYCKLITHADYFSHAACLGIEYHLRTLVVQHFDNVLVRRSVERMDAALAATDSGRGRRRKRSTVHNRILKAGPDRALRPFI